MARMIHQLPVVSFFLIATLLVVASYANGEEQKRNEWKGEYKGQELTLKDLKVLLDKHRAWLEAFKGKPKGPAAQADPRRVNSNDANLSEVKLANLSEAERKVHLKYAPLSKAKLDYANLTGACLGHANLTGAELVGAILSGAVLNDAILTGAILEDVNLTGARLVDTNLSGAYLEGVNLRGTIFEPKEIPGAFAFRGAKHLSELKFSQSPGSLIGLRESFKKAGLLQQEREVTFAIQHGLRLEQWEGRESLLKEKNTRQSHVWWKKIPGKIESVFKLVFFELTTKWGLVPGRALCIMGVLLVFFAIPYSLALCWTGGSGIWRVWDKERLEKDLGGNDPRRITVGWHRALLIGLYFSLLSAFRIGWRELNVGNWISRIQLREYTLQATGWVRTVSGIQSLISMYLLALWVLTFFGRPFE